jgi:surface antigen
MNDRQLWWVMAWGCAWIAGCSAQSGDQEKVARAVSALSACDETVPANRNIDGIPAYTQCDASANSAIYSNNGIDTSLTAMGSDWIRTQWSGGYQCTELAHRYLHFKWSVDWIPNGNAGQWCDTQPPADSGLVQTTTPVHGDLMVLAPGSCGAAAGVGHVNVVDGIDSSGKLTAVEQNPAGRNSWYTMSCGKCFLHVVANDGSGTGNMLPSGSGGAGAAGMGAAGIGATQGTGGAAAGTGGIGARAAGAGGMFSPPVTTPAMTPPPASMPAPATPPMMLAPAVPAPAMPVMTAGSGGAAALPPAALDRAPRETTAAGCSVARAGDRRSVGSHFGVLAFALAWFSRRTLRYRRVP